MKTITVNFTDFFADFNPLDNVFLTALRTRYKVEISNQPQYLFYSCFGAAFRKYAGSVRIFYTGENIVPNFNECDFAIGFNHLSFENRYLRYNINSAHLPPTLMERSELPESMASRKFCNFVYSNDSAGAGARLRREFCQTLMKYRHVDCPGRVLQNMTGAITPRLVDWEKGKIDFLRQYKFTIAFENSSASGYTTEKMHHPLMANSVPIYWGDPNAAMDVNPSAFVNCHAFASFADVIEHIKALDQDDHRYLAMLRQPAMQPTYNFDKDAELNEFLAKIIESGAPPFDKNPMNLPPDPRRNSLLGRSKRKLQKLLRRSLHAPGCSAR